MTAGPAESERGTVASAASNAIPPAVLLILSVELFERFCFYTIQGSQKSFMNQRLGYDNAQSTTISLVWGTFAYVTCLFGGVLGDRFIGRYSTIAALATWYVIGAFAMSVSTLPSVNSRQLFLLGSFVGVAVGTGGIKPLVCNFGADQLESDSAKEKFFSYFYWMIQVGAGVALGAMTTIATDPKLKGMGYFYSYMGATGGMALAVVVFLAGTPFFKKKFLKASTRIFGTLFRSFAQAARRSFRGKVALLGWVLTLPFFGLVFWQAFATGELRATLAWVAFAISVVQLSCLVWAHSDSSFLEVARAPQLGETALSSEDVQLTFQTIPVILVANMVFNFAYSMMLGPFFNQSCQMDLRMGWPVPQLNGAFFNLADTVVIILGIPVFEKCLFPLLRRRLGRDVKSVEKLYIGFFFALLAMISAAVLEVVRRGTPIIAPPRHEPGSYPHQLMGPCEIDGQDYCSNCAPQETVDGAKMGIYMSNLSGFWMLVPYAFIGIGEILINPVLYYYAYSMTPSKTQSVIQAVNLIFQGAYPPALTGVFITAFASAMPNDLNKGHIGGLKVGLEAFYYIGTLFIILGTPLLMWVIRTCKLAVPPRSGAATPVGGSFAQGAQEGSFVQPRQQDEGALLPS